MALAIFKGFSKGFVVAIFSFLAIFIGLAAALKLSVTVADWLGRSTSIGAHFLPILSFFIVLICVAIVTRIVAKLIEKTLQFAMLGFINKLAGILLYMVLYTLVFSVILFFANQVHLLSESTISSSNIYNYIQPLGPRAIGVFGDVLPWFKNMFQQLETFFGEAVHKK